jgi:hypothetical protein
MKAVDGVAVSAYSETKVDSYNDVAPTVPFGFSLLGSFSFGLSSLARGPGPSIVQLRLGLGGLSLYDLTIIDNRRHVPRI